MKFLKILSDFYKKLSHFGHQLEVGDLNRSFTNLQNLEEISIPFLNIKVNLYHAFKLVSKYFTLNNEFDDFTVLLYDSDKRLIVESLLINIGADLRIIQDVIDDPIPEDFNLEGEDSVIFQSVNKFIQNKYSVQIGRIKIIDIHCLENIIHTLEQSNSVTPLILKGCKEGKIRTYPQMPILSALQRINCIFPDYTTFSTKFSKIFNLLGMSLTFFDEDWYITFLRTGDNQNSDLVIAKPFEFGRTTIHDHYRWTHFMKEFRKAYKKRYNATPCYFIDINWVVDFISDVCESDFPLSRKRFEFLLQRFLYFCRQNEELWDVVPRPVIYNGYVRLLRRLVGFHVNPSKLSYWSIPSNLTQILRENFGPNDQIVILFVDNPTYTSGLQIQLYQSTIQEISYIDPNELGLSSHDTLEITYNHLVNQLGFFKTLIQLNASVIQKFIDYLLIKRNSKNPFSFMSFLLLIQRLNNSKIFGCYPETPWFRFFKQTGAVTYYRKLNKLLYDFLEF